MKRLIIYTFTIVLSIFISQSIAYAKRVALVVGNDQYKTLPKLKKAVNDARAVSHALKRIGFEVILGEDLTRRKMNRTVSDLEAKISPGDEVFFFFAGHGVAIGTTNYLIPVDMPRPEPGEYSLVSGEAFSVNSLVNRIQSRGAKATILVLDACRNNPFKATGVRSIGNTRGLTRVAAPSGVFILFSAGVGQTALDRLNEEDANPNSVFTRHLVPLITVPGLSHVDLAKEVQDKVNSLAKTVRHSQQPAYYDQIVGEIVLKPKTRSPLRSKGVSEEVAYQQTRDLNSCEGYKAFLESYPNSFYAKLAKGWIAKKCSAEYVNTNEKVALLNRIPQMQNDLFNKEQEKKENETLVRNIQAGLKRVGCHNDKVDGKWGKRTQRSANNFLKRIKANYTVDAPSDKLNTKIIGYKKRVCPKTKFKYPICTKRQRTHCCMTSIKHCDSIYDSHVCDRMMHGRKTICSDYY